jgi:hypothetical protein
METQQVWGIDNPITVRASAALPGAGAWDATPTVFAVAGISNITLYISYTRGAAGGAFDIQTLVSPYSANQLVVQNWFSQSAHGIGAPAAGVDTQSRVQREYDTYQATGAAIESFVYGPIELDMTIERIAFQCRESGAVGAPGTLHIVGVGV